MNSTDNINIQLINMIFQSDKITMLIYLILLFYSIWSWTIIFDKIFKFKFLKLKTEKFNKLFWSGKMLEDIYSEIKNNINNPSAMIFNSAMQEWTNSNVLEIIQNKDENKKKSLKERITNNMEIAITKSTLKLKYGMTFLLVVSNTATFFGLFGTVWGLINSFLSISNLQDTSLMVIAPGISNALITTIFGLIAAIPATIFYNLYTIKINNFEEEMENFSTDILIILSRELDQ